MAFTFESVESSSISPFALGKFLAQGTLDMSNPFVSQYFGNDETQEFIIFDVLKSDSLSVTVKSETGASVDADVGALNGALSANVKTQVGVAGNSEITFKKLREGHLRFQAVPGDLRERQVIPQGVITSDDLSFMTGEEDDLSENRGVIINPSRLLNLKM